MSRNPFDLLINVAAARRLTRLVTQDEITKPIREHHSVTKHEKLSYLLNCPYCVSVYTSAIVTVSSMLFPRVARAFHYALALAEFQATLKDIEDQRMALVQDYGPPL